MRATDARFADSAYNLIESDRGTTPDKVWPMPLKAYLLQEPVGAIQRSHLSGERFNTPARHRYKLHTSMKPQIDPRTEVIAID